MGFLAPKVFKGIVAVTDPDTRKRYYWEYPPEMTKWLVRYDRGDNVEIPTFRLDVYKSVQRPPLPAVVRANRTNGTFVRKLQRTAQKGHLRPIETW